MSARNILLTGGAGFIGGHLAERLLAQGSNVRVLDNLDPFYDPKLKRRNLAALESCGGKAFEFRPGDIRDAKACAEAVDGVDAVIHLAALAGVRPSIAEPARFTDVNVNGTQVLLDALRSRPAGCADLPIIFGSSSSVYGGNRKIPFAESDPVDHPMSPYAATKKAGELLCYTFHSLYGNPITCLRLFTVYGPRQRPEMAIHRFVRCLVQQQPIPFFGDGGSRRDYTYVADIVDGILAALDKASGYAIYNLGGAATTALRDLVRKLEEILDRKAILDRMPDQAGDVPQTCADVSLAERELGYRSKVPLAEGLKRFCQWYLGEQEAAE